MAAAKPKRQHKEKYNTKISGFMLHVNTLNLFREEILMKKESKEEISKGKVFFFEWPYMMPFDMNHASIHAGFSSGHKKTVQHEFRLKS
jgi:hypothetical protein